MGDRKGAMRSSYQSWRVAPARSTVVSSLILLAGALVRPQSHLRNEFTWRSRCKSWGVSSARLTLLSKLILLTGNLFRPRSHLRNGFACWFRCSVEDLANYRCQVPVGYRKGALRSYWHVWMVVSVRSTLMSAFILLERAWFFPLSHFRNGCTCWYRYTVEAIA